MVYQFSPRARQQSARGGLRTADAVGVPLPAIVRMSHIVALAILLLAADLYAQTSTVIGTITFRDQRPAVNVFVSISGYYQYTDVSGRYKIEGVPQGRQHMIIKRGQTILWEGDVNIAGAVATVDQRLP